MKTEGEAKLVVLAEEYEGDGIKVWRRLHAKYNKRTMSRLTRLQQENMYPRAVKTVELVGAMLAWEDKLKNDTRPARGNKDTRDVEYVCGAETLSRKDPGHGGAQV